MNTEDFLIKYQKEPWVRGKHDCILGIHKYVTEVYGKPFFNPILYPYSGFKSAYKQLRKLLSDQEVKTFEDILDKHYYREVLPLEGGLVAKPDSEGLTGFTYGISYSGFGLFIDTLGLTPIELNPTTDLYWSIE